MCVLYKYENYDATCMVIEDSIRFLPAAGTYRDTSLIRNRVPSGPYSRTLPSALWKSLGGGQVLMSEVPLYSSPRPRQSAALVGFGRDQVWQLKNRTRVSRADEGSRPALARP